MERAYQYNYSQLKPSVFDIQGRERKANTIVKVCQHFLQTQKLDHLSLLDVGSSSGIIDNHLANYFGHVTGIDIDDPAMAFAQMQFNKPNLVYQQGDAMNLAFPDSHFDVVVCSHVYEHVPDAGTLFEEIYRVLKPGGFCYFSGNNKIMLMEPHHRLPFLSLLPQWLADRYMRITGKGYHYHEKHLGYWSLKRLCDNFVLHDYSARVIETPEVFGVEYMLTPRSLKWRLANSIANLAKWATPHIWLLQRPENNNMA
ncbi:class I SAM-dependent methyltransferase [Parahaliea mediterranea]|uniref:Methyltransferase domain-containing protein n=1 Tax=Parahaliea mediterranea TaxID=651086 RepID=A0A939IHI0_9GAMM|nr:methyltransferase domain-containing protein [Parahaliea mediterranea]MBN7795479.1 methyltransferase domain-containing protein [Parahaliea mediterranea]